MFYLAHQNTYVGTHLFVTEDKLKFVLGIPFNTNSPAPETESDTLRNLTLPISKIYPPYFRCALHLMSIIKADVNEL